jgi:excisionase family DNA binding protein
MNTRPTNDRQDAPERGTLSIPAAARRLGISRNGAYAAARAGTIPTIRIGNRILVPRAKWEAMLTG